MADVTSQRSALQYLLVPDPRFIRDSINLSLSTLTQQGPRPGVPTPARRTPLELEASGEQEANTTFTLQLHKGGWPGIDQDSATYVWHDGGDWYGWDEVTNMTAWESLWWLDGSNPAESASFDPAVCVLPDGTALVAVQVQNNTVGDDEIKVRARAPGSTTWGSAVTVYRQSGGYSTGRAAHPCLVPIDQTGRVLLFHFVELDSGDMQVRMQVSTDKGATWAVGSRWVLPLVYPYEAPSLLPTALHYSNWTRLRGAYNPVTGQICLVMGVRSSSIAVGANEVRDSVHQFASIDLGHSFTRIANPGVSSVGQGWPDIIAHGTGFIFGCCQADPGSSEWESRVYRLPSAFSSWTDQSETWLGAGATQPDGCTSAPNTDFDAFGTGYYMDDGDFALVASPNGTLYALGRGVGLSHGLFVSRSTDDGVTWDLMGQSAWYAYASPVFYSGDASTYLRQFALAWLDTRAIMATQWSASPGNEDNSVGIAYLGGPATVTMPAMSQVYDPEQRVGWEEHYLPIDLPQDTTWTRVGGSAGTTTLVGGACRVTTAAQQELFSRTVAGTVTEGVIDRFTCDVSSGGSMLSDVVVADYRVADSTNEFMVKLRLNATELRVIDAHGSSGSGTVLASKTIGGNTGLEVKVALRGDATSGSMVGTVTVWARQQSTAPARSWTLVAESTTLVDASSYTTAAASNRIRWGHAAGSTATSTWGLRPHCSDEWAGEHLTPTPTYPDDLNAPKLPAIAVDMGSSQRTLVRARGGPGTAGDSWSWSTRYEFPITAVVPDPAVGLDETWRSIDTSAQVVLYVDMHPALSVPLLPGSDTLFLGVIGGNWRTGLWEVWDGSSYSTLATLNASAGLDLAYTRHGDGVVASGSGGSSPYLFDHEAQGWQFDLGSNKIRRVQQLIGGRWGTSGRVAQLILDGMDGSEPSSGTGYLIPDRWATLASLQGARYTRHRITIDVQDTVDGFFELGKLVLGYAVPFGQVYSWGRVLTTQANVSVSDSEAGTRRSRVLGPPGRLLEFGWTDGNDLSAVHAPAMDPDWVKGTTASGAQALASVQDTPLSFEGLWRLVNGPSGLVGLAPRVDIVASPTTTINRRDQLIWGRWEGDIRIESVQGEEHRDEVVRLARAVLREER